MNYWNDYPTIRLCEVCRDYECVVPETVCWRCRQQEMIDAEPWLDEPYPDAPDTDEYVEDESD